MKVEHVVFGERELTFTFIYAVARPFVCRLPVKVVHPTQLVEIFRNISTPFGTFAIR